MREMTDILSDWLDEADKRHVTASDRVSMLAATIEYVCVENGNDVHEVWQRFADATRHGERTQR